ncbi:hypothetical protein Y032_0229g2914 [Ancylostoma ceylanicum]|uniref:Uncharacterized protein n=1 Tax=Ancylostoma ceylanicum TaxID=53326 RepID=A0A016SGD3_9BILA|nr:hypothetical protein Y032_0229g2914 [Ancylostoma ceylanicum]
MVSKLSPPTMFKHSESRPFYSLTFFLDFSHTLLTSARSHRTASIAKCSDSPQCDTVAKARVQSRSRRARRIALLNRVSDAVNIAKTMRCTRSPRRDDEDIEANCLSILSHNDIRAVGMEVQVLSEARVNQASCLSALLASSGINSSYIRYMSPFGLRLFFRFL